MKTININDIVQFTPTKFGVKILNSRPYIYNKAVYGKQYNMHLWEFCNIFGKFCYMGNKNQFIEHNKIKVRKDC